MKPFTDRVIVLGNGESRRGLPLDGLKKVCMTYGCNALYRDFAPDVLFSVDNAITIEIHKSGYCKDHEFVTKEIHTCPEATPWVGPTMSSGPCSVLHAARSHFKKIFLVGHDLWGIDGKLNNIYKGTNAYARPDMAMDENPGRIWVGQLGNIFKQFCHTVFYKVGSLEDKRPEEFDLPNVIYVSVESFFRKLVE